MAATTTQSSANVESVSTLVDSLIPQSAINTTSILAGAGIERSESINFPNADAKFTLGNLTELAKKAFSAVNSVVKHDPTITVSRSQLLFEGRMWSAVDSIKEKIGTIASQLTQIKDSHAKIELSNDSTKEQNESASQAMAGVKTLALGLRTVLESISKDREEILQIGKESGLREPNFLRKVAACTRAVENFMSEVVADVGTHEGAQPGRAEIYLAKVVEHVDAMEDAKSSIHAVGADSRIGQVKRDLAIEFADQFAQRSGAFDTASVTAGNFLNDDDILALYDMRSAAKSPVVAKEAINQNEAAVGVDSTQTDQFNSTANSQSTESALAVEQNASSVALAEEDGDVLAEEPREGETMIAGDSATRIETTEKKLSEPPFNLNYRDLPIRKIAGLSTNPDEMQAVGTKRSSETPRITEKQAKQYEFLSDVEQHLSSVGWDPKKEQYESLGSQRAELEAQVKDARAFIEKQPEENQSYLQRLGSNLKAFFGIGATIEKAKNFISESAATLFELGSQQASIVNQFVPEIKQKFAGKVFELTEENKDSLPAPLLKAAIPEKYRDRLISFDDLESRVASLPAVSKLGKYAAIIDDNGPKKFSIERYGSDGNVDARLEVVHSREGRVGLFLDKQDGMGMHYIGSIWTPKGTAAIHNFLERNDEVFVKRTEKVLGEYYIPGAK